MLSNRQLQGGLGSTRHVSGQHTNFSRLTFGRLVVAHATRLRAKAEAEDEEAVFSVSSGLQLKARRGGRDISSGGRAVNGVVDPGQGAAYGLDAAALRDATATASTSGTSDVPPLPLSLRNSTQPSAAAATTSKQRGGGGKLPLRGAATAAAAAAAAAAASLHSTRIPSTDDHILPQHEDEQHDEEEQQQQQQQQQQEQQDSNQLPDTAAAAAATGLDPELQQPEPPPPPAAPRHVVHPLPPGVTPERDLDIHNELKGCEDWRDVLDVVADEATCLSVRTAVQALTRLNSLTRGSGAARRELIDHQAFATLKEVLFSQVSVMNNVQLANSLQAFAQLQVPLPDLLLEGYGQAAVVRADSFYPRDIATLLAAVASMRWTPPQRLLDALGFRATRFLSAQEFEARSIPTLLHSLALLGYKNPILAQAAAQRLAAPGVVASLVPQGVANSMWALGRLNAYHPPSVEAALAAFTSAPLAYKPQEVANLLWALTAFRHHPEGAFVMFARSLLNRPEQIRAADLATLLYALAVFNISPGAQVMERLQAAGLALLDAAASRAAASRPAEAADVADAAEDDDGAAAPAARPPSRTTSQCGVSVVELAHMYWGLALLGAVEGRLFARLEKELAAAWEREGEDIPESLLRTVFQGFLASRLEAPRRSHCLTPLAMDALKRAWTGSIVDESSKRGRGRRVDQVASILDSLKVTYDKRRPTGDGLALIDIALKAGADRYIALQVIDAADRCANSKQLLGQVVMMGRVLEKNGWEVRYLRTSDLDSLAPDMQSRFLEELLRSLGVRVRRGAAGAAASAAAASGPGASAADAAAAAAVAARGARAGAGGASRGSAAAVGTEGPSRGAKARTRQ